MKIARRVNEWSFEDWRFVGREIEQREADEELGVDEYYPMMNYAYPLREKPAEEEIKEVHCKTNLTVVQDKGSDEYYLALTGGGMDLSQDIAMAYVLTEHWVPLEVAYEVNTQKDLTQRGEDFKKVMERCRDSLASVDRKIQRIDESLEEC